MPSPHAQASTGNKERSYTFGAIWVVLSAVFIVSAVTTLTFGATPWPQLWSHLLERLSSASNSWNPLLDERLPRLIVLASTGAALATVGAVMQALFQNPLASPSVLGITSGGRLFVVIVLVGGWQVSYPFAVPAAAVGGCMATLLLVYFVSRSHGPIHLSHLILTGIALSTVLVAVQGALVYALRDQWQLVLTITEWEAGCTYDRSWQHVHMQLPLTLIGLFGCWAYREEINILALGDEEALNLGVDVPKVRWRLFLCVALLTGAAMAALGVIAFFGLILPHVLRRLYGPDHRGLVPLCMLGGASVLTTLDALLRILSIHFLSIGNVSAVLGGIFFIVLLTGQLRQQSSIGGAPS